MYQLRDGGSLFLRVQPNGSKLWWYRYRLGGAEQVYSIGRTQRSRWRQPVRNGTGQRRWSRRASTPSWRKRRRSPSRPTHTTARSRPVAREWIVSNAHWSEYYTNQVTSYLERRVSPDWQVADQQHQGSTSAPHHQGCGGSWREDCGDPHPPVVWANFQLCGCPRFCEYDPAALLKGLVKRPQVRHNPPVDIGRDPGLLNRVDNEGGYQTTVLALKLMALTYVRTVELRKASWEEFDLDNAMWSIPSERMKMRRPHLVPLSRQAVAALRERDAQLAAAKYRSELTESRDK